MYSMLRNMIPVYVGLMIAALVGLPLARFASDVVATVVAATIFVVAFVSLRRLVPASTPQLEEGFMPPARPGPESLFEVHVEGDRLRTDHPVEGGTSIALADVSAVWIETDDSGPWNSDVRWVIVAGADTVVVPLGATGEDVLLEWIQSLPGVDNEAIIQAMGSTTIGRYPVWTRA